MAKVSVFADKQTDQQTKTLSDYRIIKRTVHIDTGSIEC